MGAPIAYECRREELATMYTTDTVRITPLEPWESFLGSTDPTQGLLTRYLELGQVAAVIGDVLFVHGAVHEHNMGYAFSFYDWPLIFRVAFCCAFHVSLLPCAPITNNLPSSVTVDGCLLPWPRLPLLPPQSQPTPLQEDIE